MHDDNTDLVLGKVLLKLQAGVDSQQHIELLLRGRQERSVFERIPTVFVNRGRLMIAEQLLDSRIYTLVNEDAHSTIWLLAKSSTDRSCCRLMEGYSLRNSSIVSPPSRKSIRL